MEEENEEEKVGRHDLNSEVVASPGFPGRTRGKAPTCQCWRYKTQGLSPWWGDPLEEGLATHANIHAWRISVDRGAWRATVHRISKSWTWQVI